MEARVDLDKYAASVSRAFNLVALPEGALTFRPGTRFVKEVADSSEQAAILPFDPVADSAYIIEAGDAYVRFYKHQQRIQALPVGATITNGEFTGGITGWDDRSTGGTAAIAASSNRLQLNGHPTGVAWAEQDIPIFSPSTEHAIRFKVTADHPGATFAVQVGSSSTGKELLEVTDLRPGYHIIAVTPGVALIYLQFLNYNEDDIYIDDVEFLSDEPIELTSPYADEDVGDIRTTQSADVMYLFHGNYAPYKISRRGDRFWSIEKEFFVDGPYQGINPGTDLEAHNLVRNGTFRGGMRPWGATPAANTFVDFDHENGRVLFLPAGGGADLYVSQQISTHAKWADGADAVIHVQVIGKSGAGSDVLVGNTANDGSDLTQSDLDAGWHSFDFSAAGNTVVTLRGAVTSGQSVQTGYGAVYVYNSSAGLLETDSTEIGSATVTASGDFKPFRSTDVGRSIRLEHPGRDAGWGIITAFTGTQTVTVWWYRRPATTAKTESWQLGAWSDTTGYPKVGTFYQGRLFASNSDNQPQTIWGSQSQDFNHMRPDSFEGALTVQDDDALNFTLAATRVSPIHWMAGTAKRLILGTATGQWAVASRGAVLTPQDFAAEEQASVKTADQAPVLIDSVGLFTHRSQRGVYDLGFNYEIDGFQVADVTILARHVTRGRVAQIVYQEEPFSQVWARMEDGSLACCAYKRSQNVIGWTPCEIAGNSAVVESLAVIPGAAGSGQQYSSITRDELWMVVRRTINGSTKRYIEVMEGYYEGPYRHDYLDREEYRQAQREAQVDAVHVDSAITYDGPSTTSITGLSHLEGERVAVWADGEQLGDETVSSGAITIDSAATKVQIGLPYVWRNKSSKLAYGARTGSSVGQTKKIEALTAVLLDSSGFYYGTDVDGKAFAPPTLYAKTFSEDQDSASVAVPLFTGEEKLTQEGGFGYDPRVLLSNSTLVPGNLDQEDGDELLLENGDNLLLEGDQYLDAIPGPFTLLGLGPEVNTSP